MDLDVKKEIVEKLRSGCGLLSLAEIYNLPPKNILELPLLIKRAEVKENLALEQKKELLDGQIEHYVFLLKEALQKDAHSDFAKFCRSYLRALKKLKEKASKCATACELEEIEALAHVYFDGVEVRGGEVRSLKDPKLLLEGWSFLR
ncbi:MAG: hypothetical protein QMD14_05410 [Candidatus Aenigmarchaeota archaeon]|nr:hypothetical protein [Candidatus Aenigmarchaeota archaeon]